MIKYGTGMGEGNLDEKDGAPPLWGKYRRAHGCRADVEMSKCRNWALGGRGPSTMRTRRDLYIYR